MVFPRVLEQPILHFLSVRRQTHSGSKMNYSDRVKSWRKGGQGEENRQAEPG